MALLVCIPVASYAGDDTKYIDRFQPKALKGDYQAQRNLAYTYATSSDPHVANPMLGCAWYQLILLSGSQKIHEGDIGNAKVYCDKLPAEQRAVATQQAERLRREIYKTL